MFRAPDLSDWSIGIPNARWTAIDFSYEQRKLILVDSLSKTLRELDLNATHYSQGLPVYPSIVSFGLSGDVRLFKSVHDMYCIVCQHAPMGKSAFQVAGVAYDWLTDSVYYTDPLFNWIKVVKLRTVLTKTLWTGLDQPHGIALSPVDG